MQFGQSVDRLRQQVWRLMFVPVPVLVEFWRVQTEIGGEIYDARSNSLVMLNSPTRHAMRQAEKQHVTRGQVVWMTKTHGSKLAQIWMGAMHKVPGLTTRRYL